MPTTRARQIKTMLSDMRLFGILHRIQLATHAKSSLPKASGTRSKPQSAMTTTYWKSKTSLNASMINSRVSQRRDYRLALQRLILFAFVFLRRNDAVFDGVGMHGNADPIEDGQPEPEPRARDRGQAGEAEHDQRADGKQKSDAAITFVNMAEPGDDAEQGGHCVARRALCCLDGAFPFPIATIAGLRVFRQTLTAIRTKHRVRGLGEGASVYSIKANKT